MNDALPARVALLGPHQPPRAASGRAARGDARPDRPGGDRRGHDRACPRTCRPRRSTSRTSCSPSASGTSPRPRPTPRRSSGRVAAAPGAPRAADHRRRRGRSTPRRPAPCARSSSRPASRSPRPRPAREPCPTTIPRRSARSARPARWRPTSSLATPTWCLAVGTPATPTSRRRRGPRSRTPSVRFVEPQRGARSTPHKLGALRAGRRRPRAALEELAAGLAWHRVDPAHTEHAPPPLDRAWDAEVARVVGRG